MQFLAMTLNLHLTDSGQAKTIVDSAIFYFYIEEFHIMEQHTKVSEKLFFQQNKKKFNIGITNQIVLNISCT